MITFEPLWKTLKEKKISQYKLIKEYKISTGQLDRLRENGTVNTYTLNPLCDILDCDLSDIAKYTKADFQKRWFRLHTAFHLFSNLISIVLLG